MAPAPGGVAPMVVDSMDKPASMSQQFFDKLVDGGVPGPLIQYMARENVNSAEDLAFYCGTKEEVNTFLINCVPEARGARRLMVPIVKLWSQASVASEAANKRKIDGVPDMAMETPMSAEDTLGVLAKV